MTNLRKSKELFSTSILLGLLALIFTPIPLHAQRARTVTTTNAVNTTTNSQVATISKK